MTAEIREVLLDSLRYARVGLADIRALAGNLGDLSPAQVEPVLEQLLEAGEDRALHRLLQVCAFASVKLDPKLLCDCLGVCEDILDLTPCFGLQDGDAIEPLLATVAAEELPLERRTYAARLAAELTTKFHLDPQPVRKVVRKLEHAARSPEIQFLLAESLLILDEPQTPGDDRIPRWSEFQLSRLLPEQRPHSIVGGDYTVRRPLPKLGRNDPCHCGSGQKYKRCCYAKDQDLLRDASQYAGATRTDLKTKPGLVDDPAVILSMRAHELKRLTPAALSEGQLHAGYQRALAFGLRALAFEMLLEWERRSTEPPFDQGHFEDLISDVLQAGDLEVARRISDHCGDHAWWQPEAIAFRFDLLENPARFEPLERDCRKAVCQTSDKETEFDEPLIRLAYDFAPRHPALAIAFARAAIASNPERHLDNAMLLEVIGDARVDLDLAADGDPAEVLFHWIEDRTQIQEKAQAENRAIERLTNDLNATLTALEEKKQALRQTEQALRTAGAELEEARGSLAGPQKIDVAEAFDSEREAALRRLRNQVAGLKAEIGEQQTERRQLRRMLANERKKLAEMSQPETPAEDPGAAEEAGGVEPTGRPILPDYTEAFRKSLASLPPSLAAKAILAAGRFASHEAAIWRQTKPIERLPEHYRIRLSLDYRMMVHWQPGKVLRILDVIPRQDLESWIRRQG
jgi:hypothetical protein